MIQRESITIKYGKTLNTGDYNSVVMHITETYLVPEVDFEVKQFILMKATEYEKIIDEKLQPQNKVARLKEEDPKTIQKEYPQTAKTAPKAEPDYRLDNKQQKKYKCPDCGKMDRLYQYAKCYNCNKK